MGDPHPKEILIAAPALAALVSSVERAVAAGLEYGGSLLACTGDDVPLVAYALPTGPAADQGAAHLRTDAAFQNRAIATTRRQLPALTYVGDWHIHPMWLPTLSSTDLATARRMLDDEPPAARRLILLLGTLPPRGGPEVHAFVVELDRGGRLVVEERTLVAVPADGDEVRARLGVALPPLDDLLRVHAEPRGEPPSAATMARIASDLDALAIDLPGVTFSLRERDELVGAVVRRDDDQAFVLFPPEYPLGAPQVFAGALEDGPVRAVALRYGWSSRHRLADPVAAALRLARWQRRRPGLLAGQLARWLRAQVAMRPEVGS